MEEIECIVRGRVQMVMYRDFAQRHARSLQLAGTVKNNQDGTVTVVAQGPREKLLVYIKRLQKGPLLARVESVEVIWKSADTPKEGFNILY